MQRQSRAPILRYGVVVLSVTIAFLLTWFVPWLRHREDFILFFGAVTVSAWYGGRGPGLLACLLAGALWDYFIFYPPGVFSLEANAIIPLIIFLVVAILTGSLTTGLAEAEERAREQRQWLQVTLSSIGDAVIAADAAGNVTFMNSVAETLTDRKMAEAQGKPVANVFNVDVPGVQGELPVQRVFREGVTVALPAGAQLASGDAKHLAIEGNAAPIKDAEGMQLGAVVVFRDVQEREEARRKIVEYQQRLRSMASDLSLAEERERRAIADGLHDRIGQSLALTRIKLGELRGYLKDPRATTEIDEITQLLKQIISEIRSLTFELSPPILYEFGLEAALEWLTQSVKKQHDLNCTFKNDGEGRPLGQKMDVLVFQAVRELLTNVVKHAHASQATVAVLKEKGEVRVTVEDNGSGFEATEKMLVSDKTKGFGLFSIRERICHLGGSFEIQSRSGHGTCVSLILPAPT